MKKTTMSVALAALAGVAHAAVIDFNTLDTGADGYYRPTTQGAHDWSTGGASFRMGVFTNAWGSSWGGFTYSEVNNPADGSYLNEYAVYGDGMDYSDGGVYAVGYVDSFNGVAPMLTLGAASTVNSLRVNNTAYAALEMINASSGFTQAFSANDWFKLTIEGKNTAGDSVGSVEWMLADFAGYTEGDDKNDYLVNDWELVDLTSLGSDVGSLTFSLSSSDTGAWGMNTPAYFAIDQIDVVPEPGTLSLMVLGLGGMVWFRKKRNYLLR
ncbi:DUF4465 domain-containing protein [Pontiella sp.]|uniref:DUF4465 domain-containing protein n=1 Tax=Pontiella sp. TaxID=2837462 RepID=UPI003568E38A